MRKHYIRIQLIALALATTSACSVVQVVEPDFTPAPPEVVITQEVNNGSIFKVSNNRFFFEDIRARRVGDVINVILEESTNATKTASTSANKGTSIGLPKWESSYPRTKTSKPEPGKRSGESCRANSSGGYNSQQHGHVLSNRRCQHYIRR